MWEQVDKAKARRHRRRKKGIFSKDEKKSQQCVYTDGKDPVKRVKLVLQEREGRIFFFFK